MTDEKPLQALIDVDAIDARIVFADRKKNYERQLAEHLISRAVIIRPNNDTNFSLYTVRVPTPVLGTYPQMARYYRKNLNKSEILANVFKVRLSKWSNDHEIEKSTCQTIEDKLYHGTKQEYDIYIAALKKTHLLNYESEEKPRLNIPMHDKETYPLCCAYASITGISVSEFNACILAGGFCMWQGISENAFNDLFPLIELLE